MKLKMKLYEKLVGTEWEPILVTKLKKGDKFKVTEGGKIIGEYTATTNPYKVDDEEGKHWTIDGVE
jgi:hypothetical protein